jgi:predicted nucleic acid-binding protein
VLLALFDPAHEHFERAHAWYGGNKSWASCPITENGFIRIASSAAYPGLVGSPQSLADSLADFKQNSDHCFWPDSLTLTDPAIFRLAKITPKHLTDLYLLGLAVENQARFATFDTKIPTESVPGGPQSIDPIP